jgi:hypothetical protein
MAFSFLFSCERHQNNCLNVMIESNLLITLIQIQLFMILINNLDSMVPVVL